MFYGYNWMEEGYGESSRNGISQSVDVEKDARLSASIVKIGCLSTFSNSSIIFFFEQLQYQLKNSLELENSLIGRHFTMQIIAENRIKGIE